MPMHARRLVCSAQAPVARSHSRPGAPGGQAWTGVHVLMCVRIRGRTTAVGADVLTDLDPRGRSLEATDAAERVLEVHCRAKNCGARDVAARAGGGTSKPTPRQTQ